MCHVSTKESVALIRRAKAQGLDVTCETAPHYLVLTEDDLREDGSFKMNPPLRTQADRDALLEGILDGTVDMIATDHAPHSAQEKARGLAGSAMGIVGLETAFPILYTHLVRTGVLTLGKLVELMAVNPPESASAFRCARTIMLSGISTRTTASTRRSFAPWERARPSPDRRSTGGACATSAAAPSSGRTHRSERLTPTYKKYITYRTFYVLRRKSHAQKNGSEENYDHRLRPDRHRSGR